MREIKSFKQIDVGLRVHLVHYGGEGEDADLGKRRETEGDPERMPMRPAGSLSHFLLHLSFYLQIVITRATQYVCRAILIRTRIKKQFLSGQGPGGKTGHTPLRTLRAIVPLRKDMLYEQPRQKIGMAPESGKQVAYLKQIWDITGIAILY